MTVLETVARIALVRHDQGHAGTDRVATDHGAVADPQAGDVGDGIQAAGRQLPEVRLRRPLRRD